MQNKDFLILVQEIMISKGLMKEEDMEKEGFSYKLRKLFDKFCYQNGDFRFYAGRVPSLDRFPKEKVEELKAMAAKKEPEKQNEKTEKQKEPEKTNKPAVEKQNEKTAAKAKENKQNKKDNK